MALKDPTTLLDPEPRQESAVRYREQALRLLAGRRLEHARAIRDLAQNAATLSEIAGCLIQAT